MKYFCDSGNVHDISSLEAVTSDGRGETTAYGVLGDFKVNSGGGVYPWEYRAINFGLPLIFTDYTYSLTRL